MLAKSSIKKWYVIHKWTSLVCTLFLLLLCITGLPLIFHEEIDHLLGNHPELSDEPAGTERVDLDQVHASGMARYPDEFVQFLIWDEHDSNLVFLSMGEAPDSPPEDNRVLAVDARTGQVIGEPPQEGLMHILLRLHIDMFTGLPGELFLGVMGLLFVVAIVSGIVVYAPFMRKLEFGTVRRHRSKRLKWLDLHNLLGIVTLTWALTVGLTGAINTWAIPILHLWRADQLAEMVRPYQDREALKEFGSLEQTVQTAQNAVPGMEPSFVAFPGTLFSSPHHYAVFMRGDTPLTARLLRPALIDAQTAELTDSREMPWYVTTLLVSQPLHFGDYGGMPMKIIWALLDIITIIVLVSGLYLWWQRRGASMESRLAEIETGGSNTALAQER